MAHIGPTVRERRQKLGWTIQKLATLSGLDAGYVSRLEREESGYTAATEENLAKTLGTTVAAFHGSHVVTNVESVPLGHRRIPVLDYIQAGRFNDVRDMLNHEAEDWIITSLEHSPGTFALRIKGDSMLPRFVEGDIVVIDPAVAPRPGDFVVARNGEGEAVFKKYRVASSDPSGETVFELVPLNNDHPTWRSDKRELHVVGVMVEHRIPRRR